MKEAILVWITFLPGALGFGCAVSAQGVPPLSALDRCLSGAGKPVETISFAPNKSVRFFYNIEDQTVRGVWGWIPADDPVGVSETVIYAQPYRPTAILRVGAASLLVAGIGVDNSTLIERWDFGPPRTRTMRLWPSGFAYILNPGHIAAKATLFAGQAGGDGPINFMLTNHGAPGFAFVGFYGTWNIYSMSYATGQRTLALPGASFPALTTGFESLREEDSPTKGFLYFLRTRKLGDVSRFFVLQDVNRSGLLTGPVELLGDDYVTGGYDDGAVLNNGLEW